MAVDIHQFLKRNPGRLQVVAGRGADALSVVGNLAMGRSRLLAASKDIVGDLGLLLGVARRGIDLSAHAQGVGSDLDSHGTDPDKDFAQVVDGGVDGDGQAADFIGAVHLKMNFEVAAAELLHLGDGGSDGFGDEAVDVQSQQNAADQQGCQGTEGQVKDFVQSGMDVVRIGAGANDPIPLGQFFNEGDLADGLVATWLVPGVFDKTLTLLAAQLGHFHEHRLAVEVLGGAQVLTDQLSVGGVHNHARLQVVDPQVIAAAKAQALDRGLGLVFGFLFADQPLGRLLGIVVEDPPGRFHHMLDFAAAAFDDILLGGHVHPAGYQGENQQHTST